ncbi:MAG TPA: nuclear transport factor 2 family protein [Mycobacteriales bacterium]|jgi:uncharacterized protein (TIGR02246 family)|nr:nuclear transport factor 2 family protein [Mycobacteriales bacterium]
MSRSGPPDADAVAAVNDELYASVEARDIDRMSAVWDDDDDITCVHPGWPMLRGRARVLRSWSMIMANTAYIQFFVTDVQTRVDGDLAVVTCEENILAAGEPGGAGTEGGMQTAAVATTNVFRRRADGWRLWLHHGSPVLGGPATSDTAEEPG